MNQFELLNLQGFLTRHGTEGSLLLAKVALHKKKCNQEHGTDTIFKSEYAHYQSHQNK